MDAALSATESPSATGRRTAHAEEENKKELVKKLTNKKMMKLIKI